jgi:hypothetical protein
LQGLRPNGLQQQQQQQGTLGRTPCGRHGLWSDYALQQGHGKIRAADAGSEEQQQQQQYRMEPLDIGEEDEEEQQQQQLQQHLQQEHHQQQQSAVQQTDVIRLQLQQQPQQLGLPAKSVRQETFQQSAAAEASGSAEADVHTAAEPGPVLKPKKRARFADDV